MIETWITKALGAALKWLGDHLSFRYFSMLFLMCIAFLFGINPALEYLGLPDIAPAYRVGAVSGALLFAVGMVFSVLDKTCMSIISIWKRHQQDKAIRDHLHNLPADQTRILLRYVQDRKSSLWFDAYDGAVCDLVKRGILYRSSDVPHRILDVFPYTVTSEALPYIRRTEFQKILLSQSLE